MARTQPKNACSGGTVVDELVRRRADRQHLAAVDRRLQVGPGGEVPVERADPDAGPAGDVIERRVGPVLGERGGRRLEQLAAAAARVGAHLRAGSSQQSFRVTSFRVTSSSAADVSAVALIAHHPIC